MVVRTRLTLVSGGAAQHLRMLLPHRSDQSFLCNSPRFSAGGFLVRSARPVIF
jgi:hypothetical protein